MIFTFSLACPHISCSWHWAKCCSESFCMTPWFGLQIWVKSCRFCNRPSLNTLEIGAVRGTTQDLHLRRIYSYLFLIFFSVGILFSNTFFWWRQQSYIWKKHNSHKKMEVVLLINERLNLVFIKSHFISGEVSVFKTHYCTQQQREHGKVQYNSPNVTGESHFFLWICGYSCNLPINFFASEEKVLNTFVLWFLLSS